MDIIDTLGKYKTLGHYFDPDYERENEVLNQFKSVNLSLNDVHTSELIKLLENSSEINDKYFVADLLYLYNDFSPELLEPLINAAINHKDPSFNRIFIQPCINNFGFDIVAENLIAKYRNGNSSDLEGIKRLMYWIRPEEVNDSVIKLRKLVSNYRSNVC